MTRTFWLWILFLLATLLAATALSAKLFLAGDRSALLPGETTGVHHQIELSCHTCHKEDAFEPGAKQLKALNKACTTCHKDELKASDDSHPIKKFKDPRMADLWEKVDGRFCTSCHLEHQPETLTEAGAVSLPMDFCLACHSEGKRDVRTDRESHADINDYTTCASAGCHNYHDNRALYEDFLVKHGRAPWLAETPVTPHAVSARNRTKPEEITAYLAAVDAPEALQNPQINEDWAHSAHAGGEVGCAGCHAPKAKTEEDIAEKWVDAVPVKTCAKCHRGEASSFALGRHGMRSHPKIAKPRDPLKQVKALTGVKLDKDGRMAALLAYLDDPAPPTRMSTAEARVDLHGDAHGEMTCATCHDAHKPDLAQAAVQACTSCHADEHSRAYETSPHHGLWQAELAGDLPAGSGVTCATCHMPRVEDPDSGKIYVQHNQNDVLRPNEKMIRAVCMDCHGLSFAIDALADPALVANNFQGKPSVHIPSVDWALSREGEGSSSGN